MYWMCRHGMHGVFLCPCKKPRPCACVTNPEYNMTGPQPEPIEFSDMHPSSDEYGAFCDPLPESLPENHAVVRGLVGRFCWLASHASVQQLTALRLAAACNSYACRQALPPAEQAPDRTFELTTSTRA